MKNTDEVKELVDMHKLILDIHKMCVDKKMTYGEFFMLGSMLKEFCKTLSEARRVKSEKELLHMPHENLGETEKMVNSPLINKNDMPYKEAEMGEDATQNLSHLCSDKMTPEEVEDFAKEIYGMCVDRKITYADYSLLILKLKSIKDDIARMNTTENNRKLLHEI